MSKLTKSLLHLLKKICLDELSRRNIDPNLYDWNKLARPNQLEPQGEWPVWLILAGRGFGKTRTGAETIRDWIHAKGYRRIALLTQSIYEARLVMVEGVSGLLSIHPPSQRPKFDKANHQLIWPNGAVATLFGADQYEKLRGPQFDGAWVDELAKFKYPQQAWDQLMLGLRLGRNPRCIVTTTPKPIPLLEMLLQDPQIAVTTGTTFDNAKNLSPYYLQNIIKQYENTSLGAQELYAQMLSTTQGALWSRDMINYRSPPSSYHKNLNRNEIALKRIVVAIDPAITNTQTSDETGIIVAGICQQNIAYVLEDLSGKCSPGEWGQKAVQAYWHYKADRIVAEVNKGGDMVERIVRSIDSNVSYKAVRATRGKNVRAEPVASLYEQKKVFHAKPFDALENQICHYIPGQTSKSPDRLDALVWALTDLLLENEQNPVLKVWTT